MYVIIFGISIFSNFNGVQVPHALIFDGCLLLNMTLFSESYPHEKGAIFVNGIEKYLFTLMFFAIEINTRHVKQSFENAVQIKFMISYA